MILGINAYNIRQGGGITHLKEILKNVKLEKYKFKKVIIWGGSKLLDNIENRPWLEKVHEPMLDKNLLFRLYWKWVKFNRSKNSADILFIPGGGNGNGFKAYVTMSQNLLPFEWKEIKRYGFSWMFFRNLMLRFSQKFAFRKACGIIFLTEYAKNSVIGTRRVIKTKQE